MDKREDPYFVARQEILSSVQKASQTYKDLKISGSSTARRNSLSAAIDQILNDLDEVENTIKTVERNPQRFSLTSNQLDERKTFLTETRRTVLQLQESNARDAKPNRGTSPTRKQGSTNSFYRDENQVLLSQHDTHLDALAISADRLHQTAIVINEELEDQQRMLGDLEESMDREVERMNFVMKRLSKLLKTSDKKQLKLILWLSLIVAILIALILIL